ncbi:MAG: DUF2029 domain-containing protein [Myxococcales bacterium]|nr:DUF2029 domain-containing protein [Myxococcales bacterium]
MIAAPPSKPSASRERWLLFGLAALLCATGVFYGYAATRHAAVSDEAVFGRAALAILDGDWSLSHYRVMKPPIVYYLQAAARAVLGDSAFAGRLPGILATLGCLALVFRIGRRWFDAWTGLLAAALLAVSPFAFEYMPVGRTDAVMLFFVLLSVDFLGAGRLGWAGLAYGLAFCTKQQSAFSFPLVMALALLVEAERPAGDGSWPRRIRRVVWTFFKGTLPALAVLLLWSIGEKIPFAWLVNELQNKKYSEGAHLTWTYGRKLAHWLGGLGDFFAYWPLALFAAAAVALVLFSLPRRRAKTWYSRPASAILAIFVCLFVLAHGLRFFTLYLRFLVPLLPWVFLLTAWLPVAAARRWKTAVPAVALLAAAGLLVSGYGLYRDFEAWDRPWPEDDVPRAVRWITTAAPTGAILYTREFGPEVAYANWRTAVESRQLHGQLEKLGEVAAERVGREQFLLLSAADDAAWRDQLQSTLAPLFELQPVAAAGLATARLYRLAMRPGTGVQGEEIAYLDYRELKREPFTCEVLGRLLRQALAGGAADDFRVGFEWQVCEATAQPVILAWQATDFPVGRMRALRAAFYYDTPRVDWAALALPRRWRVDGAREARAEFVISGAELAGYAGRKNKNLDELKMTFEPEGVRITARAKFGPWRIPVSIRGSLALSGNRVLYEPDQARIASVGMPSFLLAYASRLMNPVLEIDLFAWGLRPAGLRLLAAPANALVLVTQGIPE